MKEKIDKNVNDKIDKNIDWISTLKVKVERVEDIINHTDKSLEETFNLVSQLINYFNSYIIRNKINQDKVILDLYSVILNNIKEIRVKNLEQKQEVKEAKKYIEKSMSLLRSFYDKVSKDPLTGLWNKEYINNVLDVLYEQEMVSNFSYIFLDLDNLKVVNDTYGHVSGDKLIITFSKYLKQIFGEDLNYIARIQGDEFNIISFDNLDILQKKVDKLKIWCENNRIKVIDEKGKEYRIGIQFSLGYSVSTEAKNIAELVRLADKRMYKDKYSKKKYKLR